jgi:hypothetical protein
MSQETPSVEVPPPTMYQFESESQLFQVPFHSEDGETFRILQTADEKIRYLKANGKLTTKELGGRIMIAQKGAWFWPNIGQLKYLILAESKLGQQYEVLLGDGRVEDKREFFERNVTRIRE